MIYTVDVDDAFADAVSATAEAAGVGVGAWLQQQVDTILAGVQATMQAKVDAAAAEQARRNAIVAAYDALPDDDPDKRAISVKIQPIGAPVLIGGKS